MDEKQTQKFYVDLREIIQAGNVELNVGTKLADYAWDSLAWVSTMALIDDLTGVVVDAKKLAGCETVGDILGLIERGGR